jgi:hypothetical protein
VQRSDCLKSHGGKFVLDPLKHRIAESVKKLVTVK